MEEKRLKVFGFMDDVYQEKLKQTGFILRIIIDQDKVHTQVIDPLTNEEYTLHLMHQVPSLFAAKVKEDYDEIMTRFEKECLSAPPFSQGVAKEVVAYIKNTYGDSLEFLWKNDENAVCRRKDNRKWYIVFMKVSRKKLGQDLDEKVEIIDVRKDKEEDCIDSKKYFLAYHMNKRSWMTICLDGSLELHEIYDRIDKSFELAKNR